MRKRLEITLEQSDDGDVLFYSCETFTDTSGALHTSKPRANWSENFDLEKADEQMKTAILDITNFFESLD